MKLNGFLQSGGPAACHACGKNSLSALHTIHPHPLRGPAYESVLLSCTQCGTKRLAARPVAAVPTEAAV